MRRRGFLACVVACTAAIALAVISGAILTSEENTILPAPLEAKTTFDAAGFPEVDWNYWASVNPNVIGWVTVPGTNIDQPIVQASTENPQYYLFNDVYTKPNPCGCPYLDAGCTEEGLSSRNSVIFGHNMGEDDQSMFGDFEHYSSGSFAVRHRVILLQTPTWKKKFMVIGVDILAGWEAEKRTAFADQDDFERYLNRCYSRAAVKLEEPDPSAHLYTFCSCSYNYGDNERTIVYAQ